MFLQTTRTVALAAYLGQIRGCVIKEHLERWTLAKTFITKIFLSRFAESLYSCEHKSFTPYPILNLHNFARPIFRGGHCYGGKWLLRNSAILVNLYNMKSFTLSAIFTIFGQFFAGKNTPERRKPDKKKTQTFAANLAAADLKNCPIFCLISWMLNEVSNLNPLNVLREVQ